MFGLATSLLVMPTPLRAQTLRLKDGRIVRGAVAATAGIAENPNSPSPQAGEIAVQPIYVIDDQLRRLFISKQQVVEVLNQAPEQVVKITLWQDVATTGGHVSSIGPSLGITSFDEFGRRIYEMQTKTGPLAVVQGITEITPRYAKVEALRGSQPRDVAWDMRLATTSIPPDTLEQIFARNVPRDDLQARLQVVRFYVDAERFTRARPELEQIVVDFPEMDDLEAEIRKLRQLGAQRILRELQMRRSAGQHRLVQAMLDGFPAEHVDGETLAAVREMIGEYARIDQRLELVRTRLAAAVEALADADDRGLVSPLAAEIARELSRNNVDRLIPFAQLADDASLSAEQKVALALTGWLLGPEAAQDDLAIAIAMGKLRAAVLAYLEQPLAHERQAVLDEVRTLAGASMDNLAALVAHMKPPRHEDQFVDDPQGTWLLTAPGATEDGDFRYRVQLPPEYDPYRRYPTLVVLNGAYNSVEQELDFWAGSRTPAGDDSPSGRRNGQAARHGYIVLAVEWLKPQQYFYEYSAREHLAVLTSLRDATRRLSIDSDRVYLSGHGVGADAIWDIAQAHPDLWAGVDTVQRPRREIREVLIGKTQSMRLGILWQAKRTARASRIIAPLWDRYVKKRGIRRDGGRIPGAGATSRSTTRS